MISKENSEYIYSILSSQNSKPVQQRTFRQFKARLCKIVLIGSYVIFYSKHDPAWQKSTFITYIWCAIFLSIYSVLFVYTM